MRILSLVAAFCALTAPAASTIAQSSAPAASSPADREAAARAWYASLPSAPAPVLAKHGLVAEEIGRWPVRGAGQGVAVDGRYFYGIGNFMIARHDKRTGERLNEWIGLRGGAIRHINSAVVQDGMLICSHSNFPDVPMASSVEFFDPETLQPRKTVSLGIQIGSLTWAEKRDGVWWACFANYDETGGTPGRDHRYTLLGKFDEQWRMLESWTFPPQVLAAFKPMSSSGGSWGDDGLLYVGGHDAKELYVLRLPAIGHTLEYVTTIDVPFEGQGWAWDRSEKRVLYAISRPRREVVVVRVPEIPDELLRR